MVFSELGLLGVWGLVFFVAIRTVVFCIGLPQCSGVSDGVS